VGCLLYRAGDFGIALVDTACGGRDDDTTRTCWGLVAVNVHLAAVDFFVTN
jgi:hypothetical protein